MKNIVITSLILIFCAAANAQQDQETFAVVWDWTTDDFEAVESNLAAQSNQLLDLWKEGIVENVYLNTDSKFSDGRAFPTIVFFLKANNEKDAKKTLNDMIFVKKGLSKYRMYPVGKLWLIRYEDFEKLHMGEQLKKD